MCKQHLSNNIYYSLWVSKLQQLLLKKGKKEKAEIYFYSVLKNLKLLYGVHPYFFFKDFLAKHKVVIALLSYRKGSTYYDVPFPVAPIRQYSYIIRWLLQRKNRDVKEAFRPSLYDEFLKFMENKINKAEKHNRELLRAFVTSRPYQQYRWS